jgi:hypothetical protein
MVKPSESVIKYLWIIFNLVETKMDFLSEKFLLSVGSANRESHVLPSGPMSGKKRNGSKQPTKLEMIHIYKPAETNSRKEER